MTPSGPSDLRLFELFIRYWDLTLSPAELGELERRLSADVDARDAFHLFTLQAVAAAEMPATEPTAEAFPTRPVPSRIAPELQAAPKRGWSRRRVLQFGGGAVAAGIAAISFGRWIWGDSGSSVRVTAIQGSVTVRNADGLSLPGEGKVPSGATVSAVGLMSTAVLVYPDGSTILLIGDSSVTVHDNGRRLQLHRGTASADMRPRSANASSLVLATPLLTLSAVGGALLTLGQGARAAEVEVQEGKVAVSSPSGEPMAMVREGELLTVSRNGELRRQTAPTTEGTFALDLSQPLPDGWAVGRRIGTPAGFVLRPEPWPDPYYNHTVMHQIRSDHRWSRGFFRLVPDSVIHVRYRAKHPLPDGQMCFCVRTENTHRSDTGMLEYNGGFEATGDAFRWLHVRAADMLTNKHAPSFHPPFFGFLIIFNTYTEEIGLEVAEFRVSPPGVRFEE